MIGYESEAGPLNLKQGRTSSKVINANPAPDSKPTSIFKFATCHYFQAVAGFKAGDLSMRGIFLVY